MACLLFFFEPGTVSRGIRQESLGRWRTLLAEVIRKWWGAMFDASDRAIAERLSQLRELDTVSEFCHVFYGLIARLAEETEAQASVRLALAGLLDVELRYHQQLHQLAAQDDMLLPDVQAAAERHRIGLESIREFATKISRPEALAAAVKDLVLAECNYHLGNTAEVVRALERVAHGGLNHPLVQFALGYNRYVLALETCTDLGSQDGSVLLRDGDGFQVLCLQAVSALEDGLSGGEFDSQLYWWMGVILSAAGLTEAATDAYDKSASMSGGEQEAEWYSEGRRDSAAVPQSAISDDEIRLAGELLKGTFSPHELLGLDSDT